VAATNPIGRRNGSILIVVALLMGAGVAEIAVATRAELRHLRHERVAPPRGTTQTTAADDRERAELVAVFEQGRRATWYAEFKFERRLRNGQNIATDESEVNRPPDHVAAGLGGIGGIRNGHRIACDNVNNQQVCAPNGPAASFDADVAERVANLSAALEPPNHWYRVERGAAQTIAGERARCYRLRRIVLVPAPPYGEQTVLCFGRDGVPLRVRTERIEGTDDRVATVVRHTVTDADFDTVQNAQ